MTALPDTQRPEAFPERQAPRPAARIAGAAYLVQYVTSVFPMFYIRPSLIVSGDAARTASNIAAHAQLFRFGIVCDLLAGVFVTLLRERRYEPTPGRWTRVYRSPREARERGRTGHAPSNTPRGARCRGSRSY